MTAVEFAVRSTVGDDTTIVPVADETLMRQTVTDLREQGLTADPVTRTAPEWALDQVADARIRRDTARERVLSAAQRFWEQDIDWRAALAELRPLHTGLTEHRRAVLLGELVSELEHQEDVEEGRVVPAPGEDRESMRVIAERMVREAADKLIGEAS